MDSEDDMIYDEDSEGEVEIDSSDNEDFVEMAEPSSTQDKSEQEEFPFEVLTADKIVKFMVDCIKEVNVVVQVCLKVM